MSEPTEAEQLVAELAGSNPYRQRHEDMGPFCCYCNRWQGVDHVPTCLWLRAQPKATNTTDAFKVRLSNARDVVFIDDLGVALRRDQAVNLAYHLLRVADPDGTAFEAFKEAVKRDG